MDALLSLLTAGTGGSRDDCSCRPSVDADRLVVDADDCPGSGRLESEPACRSTVVDALTSQDVETVTVHESGQEVVYEGEAAAFLVAAGRFVDAAPFHDERLADRARRDPLAAAREAVGRAGPIARLAAETGLDEGAARADTYEDALRSFAGPRVSRSRVAARPPADAHLVSTRELDTGATVRVYERPDHSVRTYHLEPVERRFDGDETATLEAAYERLAAGAVSVGERAPGRAVRAVADGSDPVERLVDVLRKHTRGYGVLEDFFADDRVSDVFATAPVAARPLRVRVDGDAMRTNVRLTDSGADALSSRFRRESGRAFSGADPTLDAAVRAGDRHLRVAGVTDPVSEGVAFAFRARDPEPWTLPALVANGTVPGDAAALLSLAVERGAAGLVAGPRGAGKTTLLGALLWEVPPRTRTVVIEDTPELPVDRLQETGRDVQGLRSSLGGTGPSPTEALRTALRMGSGALAVGEIRGEEAGALYEAMRVGANDGAVLGTIHGDGGDDVRERVVADLGVPESSFGVTDLLVTLETARTEDGPERRIRRIEEVRVVADGTGVAFEALFDRNGDGLLSSERIERGNSRLIDELTEPGESYAAFGDLLDERERWLSELAAVGYTAPENVERARARQLHRTELSSRDGPDGASEEAHDASSAPGSVTGDLS